MTRRITIPWPDPAAFRDRGGAPLRLLAVSDDPDPALDHERNREALGKVDLVVGCGDLERDHLAFLGDAFRAPVVYVRGNHDRGLAWEAGKRFAPDPLPDARVEEEAGLRLIGLSWPGDTRGRPARDELGAWRQALRVAASVMRHGSRPALVLSHVPPRGAGDDPNDPYHVGFVAYRWLARRLHPPLWLHGHTTVASVTSTGHTADRPGARRRLRCIGGADPPVHRQGRRGQDERRCGDGTAVRRAGPADARGLDRHRAQPG